MSVTKREVRVLDRGFSVVRQLCVGFDRIEENLLLQVQK